MSNVPVSQGPDFPQVLRRWFLVIGGVLIVLGLVAVMAPFFAGLATVILFGSLLLVSGVVHGVAVFQARSWTGSFLHLLMAVLALAIGVFCFKHAEEALIGLTEILAIFFVVGGLFRVFGALLVRHNNWIYNLLSGLITLVLGVMVWNQLPYSADWLIGLYVGIDLLFQGITVVGIAMSLPRKAAPY